jgi:3D (Asp-Asp-Asp) domain-containing protein
MPFVPVANGALVEVRMSSMGQQVENTLWFETDATPTEATLTDLADAVGLWWRTNIKPITSSRVSVTEYVATSMDTATSPQVSVPGTVLDVGASTPNVMPLGSTLTVSFRTGLRGRSFRGRNYVIGMTEDQVDGNSVVAGVAELWRAAYEELIAAATDVGWTWIVASRFSGTDPVTGDPTPRAAAVTTPITAVVVVDDFVDSQRRRLSGRGN